MKISKINRILFLCGLVPKSLYMTSRETISNIQLPIKYQDVWQRNSSYHTDTTSVLGNDCDSRNYLNKYNNIRILKFIHNFEHNTQNLIRKFKKYIKQSDRSCRILIKLLWMTACWLNIHLLSHIILSKYLSPLLRIWNRNKAMS